MNGGYIVIDARNKSKYNEYIEYFNGDNFNKPIMVIFKYTDNIVYSVFMSIGSIVKSQGKVSSVRLYGARNNAYCWQAYLTPTVFSVEPSAYPTPSNTVSE